jgi:hypothetical protein
MQSLREKEKELRELRRRCGRYGMSRDFAMQRQLADECYKLHLEIENSKRNAEATTIMSAPAAALGSSDARNATS